MLSSVNLERFVSDKFLLGDALDGNSYHYYTLSTSATHFFANTCLGLSLFPFSPLAFSHLPLGNTEHLQLYHTTSLACSPAASALSSYFELTEAPPLTVFHFVTLSLSSTGSQFITTAWPQYISMAKI